MKAFVRDFGIVTMLALALTLCAWLTACTAGEPAQGPRAGVARASLITIMRLEQATPESYLETGRTRDSYAPACGAFAVQRLGRVQLATAAHCVKNVPAVRYARLDGWGLGTARVHYVSEARDVAFLDPDDSTGMVALVMAQPPGTGERVRAFSPVFDQTSLGLVSVHYTSGMYETTQVIVYGWSGSPVVDSLGRAVGVVAKCADTLPGQPCKPGHTLVASLL
jgi:trypsin-like peptidase